MFLLEYLHHVRVEIDPLGKLDSLICNVSQEEVQRVEADIAKIVIACDASRQILIATFGLLSSCELQLEILLHRVL